MTHSLKSRGLLASGRPFPILKFNRVPLVEKRLNRLNLSNGVDLQFVIKLVQDVACDRDVVYVRNRYRSEGPTFLYHQLPQLGHALRRALATSVWSELPTFGSRGSGYVYPRFLSGLFKKVFKPNGEILEKPCVTSIKHILQICSAVYKADDKSASPEKSGEMLSRFRETERYLSGLSEVGHFDTISKFLNIARNVINQVIPSELPSGFPGRPGPGAVADLDLLESRYEAPIPNYPDLRQYIDEFGFFFNDDHRYGEGLWRNPSLFDPPVPKVAVLVGVPKDARGPRLICKEPWALQWAQQGLKDWFINCITSSPLSGGRVNFEDQTVNQLIALEGSRSMLWSTLDLKDASDRVSIDLTDRLFSSRLPLYARMKASRSEFVDVRDFCEKHNVDSSEEPIVRLTKFAAMGSAMCFPVLSLVCFATSVAAIHVTTSLPLETCAERVRVYGDDIAVWTEHADSVAQALELVGLAVNKDKSFVGSPFLESCGVESYDGYEITPIKLGNLPSKHRKKGSDGVTDPSLLVSYCEQANALLHAGYLEASSYLFGLVEKVVGPLPYGPSEGSFLRRVPHYLVESNLLELNFEEGRGCLRTRRSKNALETLIVWGTESITAEVKTSGYGHMLKIHRSLGSGRPLPKRDCVDVPKRTQLIPFDWQPDGAISDWLP